MLMQSSGCKITDLNYQLEGTVFFFFFFKKRHTFNLALATLMWPSSTLCYWDVEGRMALFLLAQIFLSYLWQWLYNKHESHSYPFLYLLNWSELFKRTQCK